jgi:AcrR family transcriptional regulator
VVSRHRSDARRGALVEAAIGAFARSGLYGTPVKAVTDAVGVTQSYAFSLFGTKKGLYLATIERCFDRVAETLRMAAETAPKDRELQAMAHAYVVLLRDGDTLQFQLQAYASAGDREVKAIVARRYRELFELVQELGGVGPDEARAFMATGMLRSLVVTLDLDKLVPELLPDSSSLPEPLTRSLP